MPFWPHAKKCGLHGRQRGITLVELMIAGLLSAIVALAVVSMFITSLDTWDQSGARLALQREADLVVGGIVSRVRMGSRVVVADSTSLEIYRATVAGDSLIGSYDLVGDQLRTGTGSVLVDKVTDLSFATPDGVRLKIRLRMEDDMGTGGLVEDDEGISIEASAFCRNEVAH